jgi:hypothetical protein
MRAHTHTQAQAQINEKCVKFCKNFMHHLFEILREHLEKLHREPN